MNQAISCRSPAYIGVIETRLPLLKPIIVHRKRNIRHYFIFPSIQVEQNLEYDIS